MANVLPSRLLRQTDNYPTLNLCLESGFFSGSAKNPDQIRKIRIHEKKGKNCKYMQKIVLSYLALSKLPVPISWVKCIQNLIKEHHLESIKKIIKGQKIFNLA